MVKSYFIGSPHVVEPSPWPFSTSVGFLGVTLGSIFWWNNFGLYFLLFGFSLLIVSGIFWWNDIVLEGEGGFHSSLVSNGLRMGMVFFILSEVFFFFGFFWAYFHSCVSPSWELGGVWPPYGYDSILVDYLSIPLLNSVLLLSSGATVTWCHHYLVNSGVCVESRVNNIFNLYLPLVLTIFFGGWFLFLQVGEYSISDFSLNSSLYGSSFYMLTGFHGCHVFVGVCILLVSLLRLLFFHLSSGGHIGLEVGIWYWHFVDVVWLFLYVWVYWYGFTTIVTNL